MEQTRSRPPILRKAVAGLVLVAAAALVIHLIVGLVVAVFWIAVVVAAVIA
jgi:flagellar biosynthesis protein FliQ